MNMKTELGRVVLLVNDYDEAFDFYEKNLGYKAKTDEEKERVGNQTSGQPVFVLYTDSFDDHLEKLLENEVSIVREPEITEEYMLLNFSDLYGNVITLVQLVNT